MFQGLPGPVDLQIETTWSREYVSSEVFGRFCCSVVGGAKAAILRFRPNCAQKAHVHTKLAAVSCSKTK